MSLPRSKAALTKAALLSGVHPDEGDEFQQHLHMQSATRAAEGRPFDPVHQLRVQRVFVGRLAPMMGVGMTAGESL
jgi:hypothetical protein